ncbi:MAG: hypothetical protein K9L17_13000 [Clostridiales bacterium]|nr:hypothetical protein [Clostridiales bacterium]MCF8023597.1 hypothetical protein [Clostridiales bacterium]
MKSFKVTAHYFDGKETRQVTVNAVNAETAVKMALIQRLLPVDFMENMEPRYWTDSSQQSLDIVNSEQLKEGTNIGISLTQAGNAALTSLKVKEI